MKIISYNVNGIRAAIRKGFLEWLQQANPDVLCIQETKAQKEQLDLEAFEQAGYKYNYWYSAQKKGYSGVAILCKEEPNNVVYGTGIETMDFEGRNLRVDYDNISIMSMYLPSGTNDARLNFKFQYMDEIKEYLANLRKEIPNLVVCGDYNICHEEIDIHNPKMKGVSGFLPEERAWIGSFIDSGFIDSFRHLNKEPHHYSWWSYRANARANNKGWRIDYNMVGKALKDNITRATILPEAKHSDHCPILVEIDI
ncbi:exodeoxyribonuclease III [Kordia algicida OT-1]|uniref:Exodeoxyribonuclease III n=1 Tax=Kordia algicida OT-1 TaxID=391587 RepID=A9DLD4_9FLAO|nr:exodeoxyribonuclease III [Kordia algicida]EDP98543.1 exodeoxyribonuclease III [Kordia algicida OT-1]